MSKNCKKEVVLDFMEDNPYFVTLTPEEFYWLWEDIELSLYSAQKKFFWEDKFGKLHDLTDYGTAKLLKDIEKVFAVADKKHAKRCEKVSGVKSLTLDSNPKG